MNYKTDLIMRSNICNYVEYFFLSHGDIVFVFWTSLQKMFKAMGSHGILFHNSCYSAFHSNFMSNSNSYLCRLATLVRFINDLREDSPRLWRKYRKCPRHVVVDEVDLENNGR